MADLLAAEAWVITTATSAHDAYFHLFRKNFAIVVLSVQLPQMDGYSLANQIRNRERFRRMPILLLASEEDEPSLVGKGYPLGKVDHLVKPVSPPLLKAKVKMWVDLSVEFQKGPSSCRTMGAGTAAGEGEYDLVLETMKRYKQLFDSTVEGIFGIDLDGRCTFANASCLGILGYPDESRILGKYLHGIIPHCHAGEESLQGQECPMLSAIREGKVYHGDESFHRFDGNRISVEFRFHPNRSMDGVIGGVVTFLDISERKKAEARFKTIEKEFRKASRKS